MTDLASSGPSKTMAVLLFAVLPVMLAAVSAFNIADAVRAGNAARPIVAQAAQINARLAQAAPDGKPIDLSAIWLPGSSLPLASAGLQEKVSSAVTATGGRLVETAGLPDDPDGSDSPSRVRLKVNFEIDNNGLIQFLYLIESGLPLAELETLAISLIAPGGEDSQSPGMRVEAVVVGYWKGPT